jgi:hypothetical protein
MDSRPDDPFAPLANDNFKSEFSLRWEPEVGQVCTPVPDHADDPARAATRLYGRPPDMVWRYSDPDGRLLLVVARWNKPNAEKDIRPVAWVRRPRWPEDWSSCTPLPSSQSIT